MKALPIKKYILLAFASIVTCFLIIFASQTLYSLDRNSCYERLAKDYGVHPEYSEIIGKIYEQLQAQIKIGDSNKKVNQELQRLASLKIVRREFGLNGAYNDIVIINFCRFNTNGFTFLFSYTKEGKLVGFIKFLDD